MGSLYILSFSLIILKKLKSILCIFTNNKLLVPSRIRIDSLILLNKILISWMKKIVERRDFIFKLIYKISLI